MASVDNKSPKPGGDENQEPKTRVINEDDLEQYTESQTPVTKDTQVEDIAAAHQTKSEMGASLPEGKESNDDQSSEVSFNSDVGKSTPPPPVDMEREGRISPNPEEKTWASIAHLSILLNLFTVFIGPLAALIIYLVYKDKSRYIAYQSMQALIFQLVFWIGAGIIASLLWIISLLLMIIIIGCCLAPVALFFTLVPVAALVYGVIGAIETSQGNDFKYWLISDWVRGILEP